MCHIFVFTSGAPQPRRRERLHITISPGRRIHADDKRAALFITPRHASAPSAYPCLQRTHVERQMLPAPVTQSLLLTRPLLPAMLPAQHPSFRRLFAHYYKSIKTQHMLNHELTFTHSSSPCSKRPSPTPSSARDSNNDALATGNSTSETPDDASPLASAMV